MQIVFHLGAHCTDDGRLVRALLRSRARLFGHGVAVPPPRHYRQMIRETLAILNGAAASPEVQALLLETLTESEHINRIVLFHENLICLPQRAISEEGLYPMAGRRIGAFRRLFPSYPCEFHMALCNPATLIPALARLPGAGGYDAVMAGANMLRLRWAPTIRAIVAENPGVALTLWCNEDTPLIWPEVLRGLTGLAGTVDLEGDGDLLAALLSEDGQNWLASALSEIDAFDVDGRRERVSEALEAYALPEQMEVDIDLPGWTAAAVEEITQAYITDCVALADLPGVRFLMP